MSTPRTPARRFALFAAAAMMVAGLSIGGCAKDPHAEIPEPEVYGTQPPVPQNEPARVTGDITPAQREAADADAQRSVGNVGTFSPPRPESDQPRTTTPPGAGATNTGANTNTDAATPAANRSDGGETRTRPVDPARPAEGRQNANTDAGVTVDGQRTTREGRSSSVGTANEGASRADDTEAQSGGEAQAPDRARSGGQTGR